MLNGKLVCELPPIDSGYRREIHAIINNVSGQTQELQKDSQFRQLIIMPVVIADILRIRGRNGEPGIRNHRATTGKGGAYCK